MKARNLKDLGYPQGKPLKLALRVCAEAAAAGMKRDEVAAAMGAVLADPTAYLGHERFGELAETLMLGLRLAEGVSRTALISRFGEDALARYAPVFAELRALELIEEHSERITLSARGVLLGNEVFERVLLPA